MEIKETFLKYYVDRRIPQLKNTVRISQNTLKYIKKRK